MNALASAAIVASLVFASSIAAAGADDEAAIRAVESRLCAAFRDGDAKTIERIEDSTYTLTNTHGVVSTRADDVADARKGEIRYSEFRNHDQVVRLYGDAAIVIGITSIEGTASGQAFAKDVRFTDTWVRRPDGWRIVASHASPIDR